MNRMYNDQLYYCHVLEFRTFRIYDDDRSNRLSVEEFAKGIHDYGTVLTQQELRELFDFLDSDGSGNISFDEFLVALRVSYHIHTTYARKTPYLQNTHLRVTL